MSDIALRTIGLGKMYRIGGERQSYATLRDSLARAVKRPIERIRNPGAATHTSDDLWALRDVDLQVRHGEALGVIGRNGAGKTTLLKVLSRITEPTEGRVEIRGRVGSLLEVGTGFHAELTGRENVQLNGAILGMTRAEIKSKFDEIVEFSEIGRFLDTPVKRYSSGMYVRLAFAVAAHLDPEILIVDEVLAVGDVAFQRKCLGRMDQVTGEGRTVLFVSHNMQAVRSLCPRAIELNGGTVVSEGEVGDVIDAYLGRDLDFETTGLWRPAAPVGDDDARLVSVRLIGGDGRTVDRFLSSQPVTVEMVVDVTTASPALCIGFDLDSSDGGVVLRSYQTDTAPEQWPSLAPGLNRLSCAIPASLLNEGRYRVLPRISIHDVKWIVHEDVSVAFDVVADHAESPYGWLVRPGVVAPVISWHARPAGVEETRD